MQKRPSKLTGALVRFCTCSQYVTNSALERCTRVVSLICATVPTVVGIAVHRMCHVAGQLNVNQVFVWLAVSVPVNCTPQAGAAIQPSTGISQMPRLRVAARSTQAWG